MAEQKTLRRDVGQLLIAGLESAALSSTERAWLRLLRPSGVILFHRNIETPAQTAELLREAAVMVREPLLRCVDVEGGLVDRFRDAIGPTPSAAAVAATAKTATFKKHGALIGRAARLLGFNTVFAPVVDLALPASETVLLSRAVSADPASVVRYAKAFLAGLAGKSVLGCLKHFPGLGGGTLDSHQSTPVIERTSDEMWNADLVPFRQLASIAPMVMVSHAAYPLASPDAQPASISRHWIAGVLRKRIGYIGLVISDDMEMGGIRLHSSIEDAAVSAIAAGTDLIEICKNPALVFAAYEAVLSEAEKSSAFRRRVQAASRKVRSHKQRLLDTRPPRNPLPAQIESMRRDAASFAEAIARRNA